MSPVPVVRAVLGVLGTAAILAALVLAAKGAWPAAILPILAGIVLLAGALFEHVRYKSVRGRAPRGFVATGERFVDPTSRRLVDVYSRPGTGERAYVDAGPAPPDEEK